MIQAKLRALGDWVEAKTDNRFCHWLARNVPTLIAAASLVLMVVVVFGLGSIISRQHRAQIESCGRGNETRPPEIRNLRGDRRVLKGDVEKLTGEIALLAAGEPLPKLAAGYLKVDRRDRLRKETAIGIKTELIQSKLNSIAPFVPPGGDPRIADCDLVYP